MKSKITTKNWALAKVGNRPNRAWVEVPPFGHGTYLLWPVNSKQLNDEFYNVYRDVKREDLKIEPHGARFIAAGDACCIAFADAKPDVGVIAHEALHYAIWLLNEVGAKDEETLCYTTQHVTKLIYNYTRGLPCRV